MKYQQEIEILEVMLNRNEEYMTQRHEQVSRLQQMADSSRLFYRVFGLTMSQDDLDQLIDVLLRIEALAIRIRRDLQELIIDQRAIIARIVAAHEGQRTRQKKRAAKQEAAQRHGLAFYDADDEDESSDDSVEEDNSESHDSDFFNSDSG